MTDRHLARLRRPELGLGLRLGLGGSGLFNPAILFANGEQGVLFTPSPSTCFTDTSGTTPAAVGDAVARINDLSGRGNHATQSTAASRPILRSGSGGYYLEFDGVDDFLVTGNIDFSATDKVSLFAGIRKIGDLAFGTLVEFGTDATAGGAFGIFAPGPSPFNNYQVAVSGTAAASLNYATFTAPINNVVSALLDIGGAARTDEIQFRVNGAVATGAGGLAGPAGTGNFGSGKPLYIGSRAGSSIPFNGHIYGLIARGGGSTLALISQTERVLASKSGVSI